MPVAGSFSVPLKYSCKLNIALISSINELVDCKLSDNLKSQDVNESPNLFFHDELSLKCLCEKKYKELKSFILVITNRTSEIESRKFLIMATKELIFESPISVFR